MQVSSTIWFHLPTEWSHGVPTYMAELAQDRIATNCSEFIGKREWLPNSSDSNPIDYHV